MVTTRCVDVYGLSCGGPGYVHSDTQGKSGLSRYNDEARTAQRSSTPLSKCPRLQLARDPGEDLEWVVNGVRYGESRRNGEGTTVGNKRRGRDGPQGCGVMPWGGGRAALEIETRWTRGRTRMCCSVHDLEAIVMQAGSTASAEASTAFVVAEASTASMAVTWAGARTSTAAATSAAGWARTESQLSVWVMGEGDGLKFSTSSSRLTSRATAAFSVHSSSMRSNVGGGTWRVRPVVPIDDDDGCRFMYSGSATYSIEQKIIH
ncbi:hypothetical protein K438DRAFT_1786454 [Mycena galopus ATCC 62051]|nr:hypothetical protein K438DRAFT_1786454 [Mycena galopus ATCC 62051]